MATTTDLTEAVVTAIEAFVAELDDDQFAELVARTREPRTDDNADETAAARATARKLFGK
ncbi:hypothetical protein [Antrihabitans stalactiti]|uniref:Uncharacterized protein n=1 Tax=Antrihabitans stalactiti TaxID=2584121 RepID=A0A848K5Q1_9NOCA|nr:hypothetical protein [Antrihabitans stalactiti]NMN93901.1 hypothetical protein [Antrihabitans stalactiti]